MSQLFAHYLESKLRFYKIDSDFDYETGNKNYLLVNKRGKHPTKCLTSGILLIDKFITKPIVNLNIGA